VNLQAREAHGTNGLARCFKCPKERRGDDAGWHFMDIHDRRGGPCRFRVYVCPRDYLLFAVSERIRWSPILGARADEPAVETSVVRLLPVSGGPNELIARLSHRGLTGWAFLVRDVAEGRVRRLHLRQLPADPEIRQALVAYLKSAGAEITLARYLLPHSLHSLRDATTSGGLTAG